MGATLDNLDDHITTLLRSGDTDNTSSRGSGLGGHDRGEDVLTIGTNGDDTNGVGDVLDGGDGGVSGLLNVGSLVLLDEGGLESSTTGQELGGVDGSGGGSGGQDVGGLGEDATEVVGDTGSVRSATRQDDLVNIEDVEAGLLDNALDEAVEALKHLAANHLVSYPVDGDRKVETVRQTLHAELSVAAQAQGSLGSLGLEPELGETAGVLSGVDVVLLLELLGEVVHESLVQVDTGVVVVVGSGQDGVHAAARGDNGDIRAGSTKVGNDNDLVLDGSLGASVVGQDGGNRVGDELENLDAGIVGGLDQGLSLLLREVGGNGDDGRGDLLAQVVGGRADEASQVSGSGLRDGDGGSLVVLLVLDSENDRASSILWVGRSVGVGRVDGLEPGRLELVWFLQVRCNGNGVLLTKEVSEVGDGVVGVADEEVLGLATIVLVAINVGEDGRNLSVC